MLSRNIYSSILARFYFNLSKLERRYFKELNSPNSIFQSDCLKEIIR